MLSIDHLTLRRGPEPLFEDATLAVHAGWRVALTGANGAGKSSLFAMILGELGPDRGDFHLPAGWTIAHVAQETPAGERSALDYVLDGDGELRRLQAALAEAEQAHAGRHIGELHARLDGIDAYTAESRAARLLHGLGFRPGEEGRALRSFSGGWRMRLNLAQALMCRSDLLLLDEPTNHLDLDAVIWLEQWLAAYRGTLLLISHDREFLDRIVTHVAHIEQRRLTLYTGNYSAFEQARAEALAQQQSRYERQQRESAHMQSFVDRFRYKATKARQAQSRLKTLERMVRITPAHAESPFHFDFLAPERLPTPLLRLQAASAGYGEAPVITGVELTLRPGDQLGLLGPNGAGKSTLIRLLAGELAPLAGRRESAADLRLGYFAQHQLEQLDPQASPASHLRRLDPSASEQSLRDFLGGFGFHGDQALAPVAPFSGGEKARLVLAQLVYQRPNLLLLDEPTNHLDLEMRHALAVALQGFAGALVVVSHDRYLLKSTCDRLMLVADGQAREFDGDLDDYRAWFAERTRAADAKPASSDTPPATDRKARRREEAEQRRRLKPLRDAARDLERRHAALEEEKAGIEAELAEPSIYEATHKQRLQALLARQGRLAGELEAIEQDWLELTERLEAEERTSA